MSKWEHLLEAYTGHRKTRKISKVLKDSLKELQDLEDEAAEMSRKLSNLTSRAEDVGNDVINVIVLMRDGGIPDAELAEIRKARNHVDGAQAFLEDMYDKVSDAENELSEAQSELSDAKDVFLDLAKSGTYDPTA